MTYNGRYLEEVRFRYAGDIEKAQLLNQLGRKFLGQLVHDAGYNNLELHQRRHRLTDGIIIDVMMYAGMKEINIFVPPIENPMEKKYDQDMCIGFIVNMTRTSHLGSGSVWCIPYVLEPGIDSDAPDRMDNNGWVWNIGAGATWRYYNTIADDSKMWRGFNENGFGKRPKDGHDYNVIYDLALSELSYDINVDYPETGPRVAAWSEGVTFYDTGHVRYTPENAPYLDFTPNSYSIPYDANVDHIHQMLVDGTYGTDDYEVYAGWAIYLAANENYLMAARENLQQQDDGTFNYPIHRLNAYEYYDYGGDWRTAYLGYPYSSVSLLPPDSVVTDDGPYDASTDPKGGYEPWTTWTYGDPILGDYYQTVFQKALNAGETMPYTLPSYGTQDTLFPSLWLHPLATYVDYELNHSWVIANRKSVGYPDVKSKAGYYKVHIPSWEGGPTVWNESKDVKYDLEIILFGSKFTATTRISGVTGRSNDKFKILVNTPVQYEIGKEYEVANKLLVIER